MKQDQESTEQTEPGTVGANNLLVSGDFIHREQARNRFEITPDGKKMVLRQQFR